MNLWTFIVDYDNGSTLVSQVEAGSLDQAVSSFNQSGDASANGLLIPNHNHDESCAPVEIEGTTNVWCITYTDKKDELVLVNAVKTANGLPAQDEKEIL
jgi:hypothetical protein